MKLQLLFFLMLNVADGFRSRLKLPRTRSLGKIRNKITSSISPRFKKTIGKAILKVRGNSWSKATGTSLAGTGLAGTSLSQLHRLLDGVDLVEFFLDSIFEFLPEFHDKIETLQAPQVCQDCFNEFKMIWQAIEGEMNAFCKKSYSLIPEQNYYDAENQNCTKEGQVYFLAQKADKIFEDFGGIHKCLKSKSEYLIEIEKDSKCQEVNERINGDILSCIYDISYQPDEAQKSCEIETKTGVNNELNSGIDYNYDY